ncbi:hypothetical protein F4780DRAFT_1216 [Xylariomycetidae sp. FL0641]|nr:hypothetical protein F4780DRAFT_1216 [Xylariomycetidae sp. FL0641]
MPCNKPLKDLMYRGESAGLAWETKGTTQDNPVTQTTLRQYRTLLVFPQTKRIIAVMNRELSVPDRRVSKKVVAHGLSLLFNHAAHHVNLAQGMSPQQFFAACKNSWHWSRHFRDMDFHVLSYHLLHARAIFLDKHPDKKGQEAENPLARAIDRYQARFIEMYAADEPLAFGNWKYVNDKEEARRICQRTIDAYWPHHLTHPDGEGDGNDKLIQTETPYANDENKMQGFPMQGFPMQGLAIRLKSALPQAAGGAGTSAAPANTSQQGPTSGNGGRLNLDLSPEDQRWF